MKLPTRFDESSTSVVITCVECPYWFAFRFTRWEAYRASESHLTRVHDVEPQAAAAPRRLFESRHADHS